MSIYQDGSGSLSTKDSAAQAIRRKHKQMIQLPKSSILRTEFNNQKNQNNGGNNTEDVTESTGTDNRNPSLNQSDFG